MKGARTGAMSAQTTTRRDQGACRNKSRQGPSNSCCRMRTKGKGRTCAVAKKRVRSTRGEGNSAMAHVMPSEMLAEQHRRMAEPGSGKKEVAPSH